MLTASLSISVALAEFGPVGCCIGRILNIKGMLPKVYNIQYKIGLKMANGATRETGVINVSIMATSKEDAEKFLKKYVQENVFVNVIKSEQ